MKIRTAALLVVGVALCCLMLVGGLWYGETLAADRALTSQVQPKMNRKQVVDSLGVMYDDSRRGEYEETDAVILGMNDNETITHVCVWRIAYSRDLFWVGFDKNENVIATQLQTKSP